MRGSRRSAAVLPPHLVILLLLLSLPSLTLLFAVTITIGARLLHIAIASAVLAPAFVALAGARAPLIVRAASFAARPRAAVALLVLRHRVPPRHVRFRASGLRARQASRAVTQPGAHCRSKTRADGNARARLSFAMRWVRTAVRTMPHRLSRSRALPSLAVGDAAGPSDAERDSLRLLTLCETARARLDLQHSRCAERPKGYCAPAPRRDSTHKRWR
jgi:hypothetical protein